jgi:hypothetical protein
MVGGFGAPMRNVVSRCQPERAGRAGDWSRRSITMDDAQTDVAGLTADQQRERAARYRRMAETAQTASVIALLLRVAERYEGMADEREGGADRA